MRPPLRAIVSARVSDCPVRWPTCGQREQRELGIDPGDLLKYQPANSAPLDCSVRVNLALGADLRWLHLHLASCGQRGKGSANFVLFN